MASEKMSRKSDKQKIRQPAFAFSAYLLKVPSNTLAGEKFTHIVRVRPIGHALKKIHRDNHRQIVSEWRGRPVNDAKISYLPSPWRRRQKCLFKKKGIPFVAYRGLIGLVVFGFSHRGIDGCLIGIDDCLSCFVGVNYQFVQYNLYTLLGGNNKRWFDCCELDLIRQINKTFL